jgi:hypothetical protein
MGIAKLFEDVRKAQERHKVLTYIIHFVLSTIMLAGFWVLIKYGVDDDRYFWLGIVMALIPGFAMLPTWVRHD